MVFLKALVNVVWYKLRKVKPWQLLVVIIISFAFYISMLKSDIHQREMDINNLNAEIDNVKKVFDDASAVYKKLSYQYEELDIRNAYLTDYNDRLSQRNREALKNSRDKLSSMLKSKNEKIASLNTFIVELRSQNKQGAADSVTIENADAITIDEWDMSDARYKVYINTKIGSIGLRGWVKTNPAEYNFDAWLDPIGVDLYVTQNRDRQYNSYLLFSDNDVKIPIMNTFVKPYKESGKNDAHRGVLSRFYLSLGYLHVLSGDDLNNPYVSVNYGLWRLVSRATFIDNRVEGRIEINIGKK